MPLRETLTQRVSQSEVVLPSGGIEALVSYFELLRKWNRKISLTSLQVETYDDEAVDRLLIEPLLAGKHLPKGSQRVLDVGSGGGSPAIPMKIASPRSTLVMVESRTRKAAFLREVIRELSLADAAVEPVRLESLLTRPELHGSFGVVTMRAVRADSGVLASVKSLLGPSGMLFLFTSGPSSSSTSALGFGALTNYPLLERWGTKLEVSTRQEL